MSGDIMKRFVVYTVLVGGYDAVLQPLVTDNRFDYVLFSNDYDKDKIGVWHVRPILQPQEIAIGDNKRLSRYPKSHPEIMLAEYEASLYIDANIQIADKWVYEKCIDYAQKKVQLASVILSTVPHKFAPCPRDDIYEHAYDMCSISVEHDYDVIKQCHALYKLGFPMHYGLNENNLIFRLHTEKMKKCDEEWWWWITNYSFRDQFSYMYCLRKYGIHPEYFFPFGTTVRNSPHFQFQDHSTDVVKTKKLVKISFGEKIRIKCKDISKDNYNRYCGQWIRILKFPFPQVALSIWTILVGIVNAPHWIVFKIREIACSHK